MPVPTFDYSYIRAKGEIIKGFGGLSSGYEPLEKMHISIKEILDKRIESYLTATDITDIMNLIGVCVVAGNVRRTAQIVFGEHDSDEYLSLKDYTINPQRAEWGWTSNNSIFAQIGMDYSKVAKQTITNGEPGYAWLENMQSYSRMGELPDYKDVKAKGGNPCLEQTLESYEMCCLVETFPIRNKDLMDYLRTLKFAYLYAKTITLGTTDWAETNRVQLRNRRIGTSMSGLAQFIELKGIDTLKDWCETGYSVIQSYDQIYSDWFCVPRSIKTTSIKPSGTVSLLPGVTPGMHFPESNYYIRRMRISINSPLLEQIKEAGYHIEEDVRDPKNTMVVEFPVAIENVRTVDQVSLWEQLNIAAFLQKYWADNQVSCTITFNKHEAHDVANALNYFQYMLKGVSFLPKTEKGVYEQMPYEEISKERYEEIIKTIRPLSLQKLQLDSTPEKYCDNDTCEI